SSSASCRRRVAPWTGAWCLPGNRQHKTACKGEQPSRPPKVAGSNKLFRQLPGLIKKNVFSIPNVTPVSIDSGPFDGVDSQPLIFETDDELRYPIGAGLVDELADRAG